MFKKDEFGADTVEAQLEKATRQFTEALGNFSAIAEKADDGMKQIVQKEADLAARKARLEAAAGKARKVRDRLNSFLNGDESE